MDDVDGVDFGEVDFMDEVDGLDSMEEWTFEEWTVS
jgi:hypothetical protein